MALVVKDRVQVTSTTTGTGTFTLGSAVSGFQDFSVIGDGNTTYYAIVGQSSTEWEVGIGTYTASGTTLSRDTILESSNGGTAVNFSAGTKNVFVTYPAEKGLYLDASGNAIGLGTPASATLTNATGLPISTGVSGLGTGVATFLGTPSSANLASAVTDETGSGSLVFGTSPTIDSPTFTSQATFAAGTATAPAFTTTGDTNTGIFFPTADTIAFTEGGAEAMRIDSSGNVGIGTTSPNNYSGYTTLTVNGASSGPLFDFNVAGTRTVTIGAESTLATFGSITNIPLRILTNATERMRITSAGGVSFGSSGTAYGTTGQVLTSAGDAPPTWGSAVILEATKATTSGSSIDFTSIPSWVKVIYIMLDQVSTNGTNSLRIQIGDSGGLETTGYVSYAVKMATTTIASGASFTNGFNIAVAPSASSVTSGLATLTLVESSTNTWAFHGGTAEPGDVEGTFCAGTKSLSATLDRLSLVVTTNTFDAGKISISYY